MHPLARTYLERQRDLRETAERDPSNLVALATVITASSKAFKAWREAGYPIEADEDKPAAVGA